MEETKDFEGVQPRKHSELVDARCTLITVIRSFFERDDEFDTLEEYLEAIKNLSNDTDKLIADCIEDVFSTTPGGDEEPEEDSKEFEEQESIRLEEIRLEANRDEATTELTNLKAQLIMNELEFTHRK